MTKNSASKKHGLIQSILVSVIENLEMPRGWVLQHVETEYPYDSYNKVYKIDCHAQWRSNKKEKYELLIEVQKNLNEPSFLEKVEKLKMINKMDSKKIFNIIHEDNVPDNMLDAYDYLKSRIQYPW